MVSEEDFSILVLSEAKAIFNNREAKYLGLSRMEKLVALVAEEVKYENLTRGWYKFGIYSPVAYNVAKNYSKYNNLQSFDTPREYYLIKTEIGSNPISEIREAILKLKSYFLKEKDDFYEWIYNKVDRKYKKFYESKYRFQENLGILKVHLEYNQTLHLDEDFHNFLHSIEMFYNSLSNFDDEIIYFTSEYVDLLEMIITKIKNNHFEINTSQREVFFKVVDKFNVDIKKTDEQNIDIFTVLASVPFKETLTGGNTEYWNKWIDEKKSKAYNQLLEELRDIRKEADEAGLLLNTDELLEEIKSMHTEKSLRELLPELS